MPARRYPVAVAGQSVLVVVSLIVLFGTSPAAGTEPEKPLVDETISLVSRYLAIDTTNPPGNEARTAALLKEVLDREKIGCEVFDLGSGRVNVVARLKGDGSKSALVMLHHMDVVGADPAHWTQPPFGGRQVDGYLYGRGAVDVKTKGILDLMTMVTLKRTAFPLKRDLVLLAVADEEESSKGARWVVEKRPDLVKGAEILIDEGANVRPDAQGRPRDFLVSIGEKYALWLDVTFQGRPGHGSQPHPDSSVDRAVRAASRLLATPRPLRLHPALKGAVRLLAEKIDWRTVPGARKTLQTSLDSGPFLEALARSPLVNSFLRDTVAVTKLSGSPKINVIPNEASFGADCRLLPGTDIREFLGWFKKTLDDPTARIRFEFGCETDRTTMSPTTSPFLDAVRASATRRRPDARVVPIILPSTTDSAFFRPLGIHCYGFEPYFVTEADVERAHGNDERIRVDAVAFGLGLQLDVIRYLNR
jgi:acetylornithine deacetylase/succinyl-diaminopimelate desuccinylase-like protein